MTILDLTGRISIFTLLTINTANLLNQQKIQDQGIIFIITLMAILTLIWATKQELNQIIKTIQKLNEEDELKK